MRAFFKMQLKIYFRLASSYVSPLVIGAFYIILVAAVRLSVGAADVQRILDSNQYIELSANFCMIAAFIISSFVTQTFFIDTKMRALNTFCTQNQSREGKYFLAMFLQA